MARWIKLWLLGQIMFMLVLRPFLDPLANFIKQEIVQELQVAAIATAEL